MTFDAFTKGLVDRFGAALPTAWRLNAGYEIVLPGERDARDFLDALARSAPKTLRPQVAALQPKTFLPEVVGGLSLPFTLPDDDAVDARTYAALKWWRRNHLRPGKSTVDFVMLNRLALHALRIELRHPASGEQLTLEAPLPADLLGLIELLDASR